MQSLLCDESLVREMHEKVKLNAIDAGMPEDNHNLNSGGIGAIAYADTIAVYLAFQVDQLRNNKYIISSISVTIYNAG